MGGDASQNVDFFISYSGHDEAWAVRIAGWLEEDGHSIRYQKGDCLPGTDFVRWMHKAVARAERTLAVLSPNYLTSDYTEAEWAAAWRKDPTGKRGTLVPVRILDCEPGGLLGTISYIDLVGLSADAAR